jgi:UDP-N-acetylmuramoyl-L-alanyl-D-glutamate--2,6-diaminopimelate ligase
MRLSEFFPTTLTHRISGPADPEVTGLAYDSRQVAPGEAFFALRGAATDGHRFIAEALGRGARLVVSEEQVELPPGVTGVVVAHARQALALAAAAFYGQPTADIPVIGVTGTNGKTTVTYLLEAVLKAAGKVPAIFGTINYRCGDLTRPALHTTPESLDLLRLIAEFRAAGADALIMEVSSHALAQHRVDGIRFDVGVFTNLTPEHLDYHGDMENYFAGKTRFFTELLAASGGQSVVNVDDAYGRRLAGLLAGVVRCSTGGQPAEVRTGPLRVDLNGIHGQVSTPWGELALDSTLLGPFNAQNLLCAAAAALALGIPLPRVAEGLSACPQVPGRLERVENDRGALVLVDYAHTGDALDKVLTALRQLEPRRVITVFGCGGDRDRKKRPVMGEVVARHADLVILTSDNPRTEDPLAILDEIRPGIEQIYPGELLPAQIREPGTRGYLTVPNRREAIEFAVSLLQAGDLLLVAGKGHEDYQIIQKQRFHFDDREELRQALGQRKAG